MSESLEERVNQLQHQVEGLTKALQEAARMDVKMKGTIRVINKSGTGHDLVVDGMEVHRVLAKYGLVPSFEG